MRGRLAIALLAATALSTVMGLPAVMTAASTEGGPAEARRLLREAGRELHGGDRGEAERLLRAAVELDPKAGAAWALLGRLLALDRRYAGAEQALRRADELGARDLSTLLYLGSTLWENGDGEAAEATYLRAMAQHGSRPPLLHQLGRLRIWLGRFADAVEPLERAAAAAPPAADLEADLASAYAGAGRTEEALASWRRAVELAPEHSGYRYGLARALAAAGRGQEAERELSIYGRLIAADRDRTRAEGLEAARVDHGWQLLRQGNAAAAAEHLRELPATPDALVALAAAYRALGDRGAAVAALERAVGLAPQREDLRMLLSEERLSGGGER